MKKINFCLLGLTFFFLNISPYLSQAQTNSENLSNKNDLLEFVSPEWKITSAPRRRTAGGKRGDNLCKNVTSEDLKLTAIIPENGQGLTVKANPTFYFFIPFDSSSQLKAELSIFEIETNGKKGRIIAQEKRDLTNTSRIIYIQASNEKVSLSINQNYIWNLTVICNPNNREDDLSVEGIISRVELEPNLVAKINKSTPNQQAILYAKAGIWYDTVDSILSENFCHNYPSLANFLWLQLMQSDAVKLNNLIEKDIRFCTERSSR